MASTEPIDETLLRFEGFVIDIRRRGLYRDGERIHLTPIPFKVLTFLAQKRGFVVSKQELLETIWGGRRDENTVEQAIRQVRRALHEKEQPRFIRTIPGMGYSFIAKLDGDNFAEPDRTSALRRLGIFSSVAALLLTSIVVPAWRSSLPRVQITGIVQLTDDGAAKEGLVTDGKELYFTEMIGGDAVLFRMAANGGLVQRMALSVPNPIPEDISRDGRFLLVISHNEPMEENSLWIVPTTGGSPFQVPGVKCAAAAWVPNQDEIVFGTGKAIYLTHRDGSHSREVGRVDGYPIAFQWSMDARHLLILLDTRLTDAPSLWQADVDDNLNASQLAPLQLDGAKCCWGALLTRDTDGYFSATKNPEGEQLLRLSPKLGWHRESLEASAFGTYFEKITGLAASNSSRKVFVLSGSAERGELVRFDLATRSFTMLLPGSFATYVDFAEHSGLVTYVNQREKTLWVSKIDGTDRKQITPKGMEAELPRWSPDNRWIAFMGKRPNHPWRIFVIGAAGGPTREASNGADSQGAPTWSPDGRFLVYGNVLCQQENSCAIHRIDLSTGEVSTLPGSQGLSTARWSRDGRYIAALDVVEHKLDVFDLSRNRWRTIAGGINGNDVTWSSDSRYIYTKSSMSGTSEILRVRASGGAVQHILDLNSFGKSDGQLDVWFSLAPDDSLILNRWLNTSEIYELSYVSR